jgi:hypothetical protein
VLSRIFNQPDFGQECFDFVGQVKDKVYMVVGLFIMAESEVAIGDGTDRGGDAPMPSIALPGLDVQMTAGSRQSTKFATLYPSQMIHSIQYRSIRIKSGSRFFHPGSKREQYVEMGGYFSGRDIISLL